MYVTQGRGGERGGRGLVGAHYSTVGADSSRGWWGVIATARVTLYVRNKGGEEGRERGGG